MLDTHSILVFIHILLFVYWLGADLGVFVLASKVKDASLSYEQREICLKMALIIDFTPRIAFTLMFAIGAHLSVVHGSALEGWWFLPIWLVTLAWLGLVLAIPANEGKPLQFTLMRVQVWWLGFLTVFFIGLGGYALATGTIFPEAWLAWKVILFGLVAAAAIGIDKGFAPFFPFFERLRVEGSNQEIEAGIKSGINGAIRWVLTLYALLFVIAFLGTTKPF